MVVCSELEDSQKNDALWNMLGYRELLFWEYGVRWDIQMIKS